MAVCCRQVSDAHVSNNVHQPDSQQLANQAWHQSSALNSTITTELLSVALSQIICQHSGLVHCIAHQSAHYADITWESGQVHLHDWLQTNMNRNTSTGLVICR